MQDTSIAWADYSWNPIRGCSRISPGCLNCYAEQLAARHSVASEKRPNPPFAGFAEFRIIDGNREAHWTGKVGLIEEKLLEPLSWRRKALKFRDQYGRKPRAFISMSDMFHENLPAEAIDRVMAMAALTPEINYMILTKRAERMHRYIGRIRARMESVMTEAARVRGRGFEINEYITLASKPLPNVALGVSVESQKYADERIPHLLRTPAAMRFVSYEPALEAVDWERCYGGDHADGLCDHETNGIDMIIVGGESGPGARPFDLAWARQTVAQCRADGVACFVKQVGSKPHETGDCLDCDGTGKDCEICYGAGEVDLPFITSDHKGEDMSEWPEDMRVREWPEGWG